MASDSFTDKDAVFRQLLAKSENQVCFDCNAENPTWASVTYGVFICLNCSSLHRTLGVHISFVRSTNQDSWPPKQLKMMSVGGNGRAQVFFKQHGWTDGGNIEAKYMSKVAELYRQFLSKEVAKSFAEEKDLLPTSPASQFIDGASGLPDVKTPEASIACSLRKQELDVCATPTAHSQTSLASSVKKPVSMKMAGKTGGGLGVQKLTTKATDNLYDQKPEEPVPAVSSADISTALECRIPSRFVFKDDFQPSGPSSGDADQIDRVSLPKPSSSFPEVGMDEEIQKTASTSSAIVEESHEARKRFPNAKSISSTQFFGDQNEANDMEALASPQNMSDSTSIASADLFERREENVPQIPNLEAWLDRRARSIPMYRNLEELLGQVRIQTDEDMELIKKAAAENKQKFQETTKKLQTMISSFVEDLRNRILQ